MTKRVIIVQWKLKNTASLEGQNPAKEPDVFDQAEEFLSHCHDSAAVVIQFGRTSTAQQSGTHPCLTRRRPRQQVQGCGL